MIWEINKIIQTIDKDKWNRLSKQERLNLLYKIQILTAINYLIHLHISQLPLEKQLKLLLNYYHHEPDAFYPLQEVDVIELFFRFQPLIPVFLYINYVGQMKPRKISKQKSSMAG